MAPLLNAGVFEVIPQGAPTCGAFIGDVRVCNPAGGLRSAQIGNSGDLWVFSFWMTFLDPNGTMTSVWSACGRLHQISSPRRLSTSCVRSGRCVLRSGLDRGSRGRLAGAGGCGRPTHCTFSDEA